MQQHAGKGQEVCDTIGRGKQMNFSFVMVETREAGAHFVFQGHQLMNMIFHDRSDHCFLSMWRFLLKVWTIHAKNTFYSRTGKCIKLDFFVLFFTRAHETTRFQRVRRLHVPRRVAN